MLKLKPIYIVLLAMVVAMAIQAASFWYFNRQVVKTLKDQIKTLTAHVKQNEENEAAHVQSIKTATTKAATSSKAINDKLKQDEKDINNRVYNNDDLERFLSRFDPDPPR